MDLLSAMIRDGASLARSVELAVQWDAILRVGPIHPVSAADFLLARAGDLGQCCQVVLGLHRQALGLSSCCCCPSSGSCYSWLEELVARGSFGSSL